MQMSENDIFSVRVKMNRPAIVRGGGNCGPRGWREVRPTLHRAGRPDSHRCTILYVSCSTRPP